MFLKMRKWTFTYKDFEFSHVAVAKSMRMEEMRQVVDSGSAAKVDLPLQHLHGILRDGFWLVPNPKSNLDIDKRARGAGRDETC
jgi:hypothetical protein